MVIIKRLDLGLSGSKNGATSVIILMAHGDYQASRFRIKWLRKWSHLGHHSNGMVIIKRLDLGLSGSEME